MNPTHHLTNQAGPPFDQSVARGAHPYRSKLKPATLSQMLPGPLVNAAWLARHLDDVRVVDVRWSIPTGSMRDAYLQAHIPGAIFADLDTDLSSPAGPGGRHPLPSPSAFAQARTRLGLSKPVVAYDDRGGPVAARLWWMLDALGLPAAVLDGGLPSWTGDLESGPSLVVATPTSAVDWPAASFINADDVLTALQAGAVLLDARSEDRYRGESNPIDRIPGRIPGATSWPWQSNLDEYGRFLAANELRTRFQESGVRSVIASCGSGVTGCHNLLAARLAGIPHGRLYTGSWSEWSQDPSRPIARDAK